MNNETGKLKIGDEWNAIALIAMNNTNPKKSIAELVENSIDAKAKNIGIVRFKEGRKLHIQVRDDGEGVPPGNDDRSNFHRVGNNICNSIKKKLVDRRGIMGEFGIGLLGFWCVGEELIMRSKPVNCKTCSMHLKKGEKEYRVFENKKEREFIGTDVIITQIHEAAKRQLTAEKLHQYLGSELRNRIKETGVKIKILDKISNKNYIVKPTKFKGEEITGISVPKIIKAENGSILKLELYISFPDEGELLNIDVLRNGTRVVKNLLDLDDFNHAPWNRNRIEGIIDYPQLTVAPTRVGINPDKYYDLFLKSLKKIEPKVEKLIDEKEEEQQKKASKKISKDIQKAFQSVWDRLSAEGYEWFDIAAGPKKTKRVPPTEKAGPLNVLKITPNITDIEINSEKKFTARPYDKQGVLILDNVIFEWNLLSGPGVIEPSKSNISIFKAGSFTGIANIEVKAIQNNIIKKARAQIIIVPRKQKPIRPPSKTKRGIPPYMLKSDTYGIWRSRWVDTLKIIEINDMHKDFKSVKGRPKEEKKYIGKLYAKELVLLNYGGEKQEQVLERFVGLLEILEKNL